MPNFLQFQGRSRHPLKQVTNDGWFFVEKLRVSWKKEGQDRTGFPTRGLKNITLQKGAKDFPGIFPKRKYRAFFLDDKQTSIRKMLALPSNEIGYHVAG